MNSAEFSHRSLKDTAVLQQVIAFICDGYDFDEIATWLKGGVAPITIIPIKDYLIPWDKSNGLWRSFWFYLAQTIVTLNLGGQKAQNARYIKVINGRSGSLESPGMLDLEKMIDRSNYEPKNLVIEILAFYPKLSEEELQTSLLEVTPPVFHSIIHSVFVKGGSVADKSGSVADKDGSVADKSGSTQP